jgi:peptidoglycan/LPS O-acetylase OafA/YrhL
MQANVLAFAGSEKSRSSTSGRTHDHIALADAFRVCAIAAVVASHIVGYSNLTIGEAPVPLSYLGDIGVDIFFVLSGYLIGGPYVRAILNDAPLPNARLFALRRFFRIYPLYLFAVIVTAFSVLHQSGLHSAAAYVVTHATFLHGFMNGEILLCDGPLWTMAVDAQFYVCLPIVAFVVARVLRGRPRHERIFGLALSLAAWIPISLAFRFAMLHRLAPPYEFQSVAILDRNVIGVGSNFALGAGLTLLVALGPRPTRSFSIGMLFLGAIFVLAAIVANPESRTAWAVVVGDLLGGLATATIFYALAEGFPATARACGTPLVIAAAELAYAIYLFHYPILGVIKTHLHIPGGPGSTVYFLAFGLIEIGLILPIAWLTHRFIERPFLQLRDRSREPIARLS